MLIIVRVHGRGSMRFDMADCGTHLNDAHRATKVAELLSCPLVREVADVHLEGIRDVCHGGSISHTPSSSSVTVRSSLAIGRLTRASQRD